MYLTRKMYNDSLQELIDHYKMTGKYLRRYDHDKLHDAKRHTEIPALVVDEVLNRLHRSFSNFFRGIKGGAKFGFPRFKSEKRWRSFSMSAILSQNLRGCRFHGGKKLGGNIRVSLPESPRGRQKIANISHKPSGWYIHIVCEQEASKPLESTGRSVGIDLGIKYLVSDSDGNIVENPQFMRGSLNKLRIAQRRIARRVKGSNRRKKACRITARIHEKIVSQRKDYYHKVSRHYVNGYDCIVMEDLQIKNMVKNHNLAMSIHDASWGMLRSMIAYKAEKAGRTLTLVNPRFTSQKCHRCGEIVQKALSVRTHVCPHCLLVEDRDINAAKNILKAGAQPSGANVEVVNSRVA